MEGVAVAGVSIDRTFAEALLFDTLQVPNPTLFIFIYIYLSIYLYIYLYIYIDT